MKLAPILLLLAVPLSGCAAGHGPQRPDLPIAEQWLEPTTGGAVEMQWWAGFNDQTLDVLIAAALSASPDLKMARARLAQARANRDAAQSGRLPRGNVAGSATKNRISENGQLPTASIPGFDPAYGLFDIGFDASWEIDLWGHTRGQIAGARAREEAALWAQRDVQTALLAELARNYVDFRAAQALAGLAGQELASRSKLSDLVAARFRAGETTRIEAEQSAARRAAAQAAFERAQAKTADGAYRIAILVGKPPEEITPELRASQARVPVPPANIARGVRSQLLERRPDIRRAESDLVAAIADSGVARADLYPRFTLLGSLGQQSQKTGDLDSGASTRFSIGPAFSWPIFSLGRVRAQIRAADARADGAAARFEKAVIGALSDSESAANRFAAGAAAARSAKLALARESAAFGLVQLLVRQGEGDRLMLERARLSLTGVAAQDQQARAAHAEAAIAFYKALGGGWSDGPPLG